MSKLHHVKINTKDNGFEVEAHYSDKSGHDYHHDSDNDVKKTVHLTHDDALKAAKKHLSKHSLEKKVITKAME